MSTKLPKMNNRTVRQQTFRIRIDMKKSNQLYRSWNEVAIRFLKRWRWKIS